MSPMLSLAHAGDHSTMGAMAERTPSDSSTEVILLVVCVLLLVLVIYQAAF